MVSDKLMFVGIHINRTGGASRERMLKKYCRSFKRGWRRHNMAGELCGLLGRPLWDLYFSFAFVRNPWDRMVSLYHHRRAVPSVVRSCCAQLPFKEWLFSESTLDGTFGDQVQWLELDGEVIVDFVGRFESMERDWEVVCDRIGVSVSLPHVNKSGRRAGYRDVYDAESRDLVGSLCARDVELFGYSF